MKTPITFLQDYYKGLQHPIAVILSLYNEVSQSCPLIKELNSQWSFFDIPFDHSTFPQALASAESIESLLKNIHFSNRLNFDILAKINDKYFTQNNNFRSIEFVVYFHVLALVYLSSHNDVENISSENFLLLLKSLYKISAILNRDPKSLIYVNTYLFHTLLNYILQRNSDRKFRFRNLFSVDTVNCIELYINLNSTHFIETFSPLYLIIIDEIMKLDDLEVKERLNKDIFDQFKSKDPLNICSNKLPILNRIKPMMLQFSHNSVNLLIYLSKTEHEDPLSTFLETLYTTELPHSLLNFITSEEVENIPHFDEKEFIYENDLTTIEKHLADNKKNYTFIKKSHKSFPKGIEMLPLAFSKGYSDGIRNQVLHPIDIFQTEPQRTILTNCGDLMVSSSPTLVFLFLGTFSEFLTVNRTSQYFPLIYTAFLALLRPVCIVSHNKSKEYSKFLNKSMHLLEIPFDQKHLIFIDGYLSPLNNLFRNEIFELLFTDIERFTTLLHTKNPFLYAEQLGRILSEYNKSHKVFPKLANDDKFCDGVITVARILQLLDINDHSELISKMRNTVFLFTFELVKYKKFESQKFGSYFFIFLFESEITDHIIQIIENYYISNTTNHYDSVIGQISKALKICAESKQMHDYNLYSQLAVKLITMIAKVMHQNIQSVNFFYSLFDVIAKNFVVFPTSELLFVILKIILFISLVKPNFKPKSVYFAQMANFIKNEIQQPLSTTSLYYNPSVDIYRGYNISLETIFSQIMSILKGTTQFTTAVAKERNNQVFLITRPQYLPFLLASFGSTHHFPVVLNNLLELCRFSLSNLVAMHNGHVDIILIKFLQQNKEKATVEYCDLNIDISLTFREQKSILLPILFSITSYISSYEVASQFMLCDQFIPTFDTCINLCAKQRLKDIIILSRMPTHAIAKGLRNDFCKESFTICFWMKLDISALIRDNARINLVSINDNKKTLMVVYASGSKIYLQFDNHNVRTQVKLLDWPVYQVKQIHRNKKINSASDWHFVSISYSKVKNEYAAKTSIDCEPPIKSEMATIEFHNDELSVSFNHITTTGLNQCSEYGYLAQFKIFDRILDKNEQQQLYLMNYKPINDFIKLEFDIGHQDHLIPKNLVQQFDHLPLLNEFIIQFQRNKSFQFLNTLKTIFESINQENCLKLELTSKLAAILSEICLSFSEESNKSFQLYLITYAIINSINSYELRVQWLKDILLNITIWSNIDHQTQIQPQLVFIVQHWISPLFANNFDIFEQLLNQNHSQPSLSSILFSSFRQVAIKSEEMQPLLIQFLSLIGSIKKSATFSSDLLIHITLPPQNLLNYYFDILFNISPYIHHSCISSFNLMVGISFKNYLSNTDILIKLIKVSYILVNSWSNDEDYINDTEKLDHTFFHQTIHFLRILEEKDDQLTATKQLFYKMYSSESDSQTEFNLSKSILEQYPNLFTLMIFLSIRLTSTERKLMANALLEMRLKNIKIDNTPFWYIFPIFLLFSLDEEFHTILLDFLGTYGQIYSQIPEISFLFIFFEAILKHNDQVHSINYKFLTALNNNNEIDLDALIKLDVNATIWHLSISYPFPLLSEEFKKSPFHDYEMSEKIMNLDPIEIPEMDYQSYNLILLENYQKFYFCPKIFTNSFNSLNGLLNLIDFALVSKFQFLFRLDILHVMDHNLFDTAQKIISKYKPNSELSPIVDYFLAKIENYFDKKPISKKMDQTLNDLISNEGRKYSEEFTSSVTQFLNNLKNTITSSIQSISAILLEKTASGPILQPEQIDQPIKKKENSIPKEPNCTMSNYLTRGCQFKFGYSQKLFCNTSLTTTNYQSSFFNRVKFNSRAIMININNKQQVNLKFYKNSLLITNENDVVLYIIDISQISMIFHYMNWVEFIIMDNISFRFTFTDTNAATSILAFFRPKNKQLSITKNEIFNPINDLIETNSVFDYLIRMNYINGRTFNSVVNYPIFPQFFDDFDSLTLKDPKQKDKKDFQLFNSSNFIETMKISEIVQYPSVPPEFYFLPEFIKLDQKVNWAKNSCQFSGKLLNFLETETAKQFISAWSQKVFRIQIPMNKSFRNMFETCEHNGLNIIYSIVSDKTIVFCGMAQFKYLIVVDSLDKIDVFQIDPFNFIKENSNQTDGSDKKKKILTIDINQPKQQGLQLLTTFSIKNVQAYQFFTFSNTSNTSNFLYQFEYLNQPDNNSKGCSKLYGLQKESPILFCFDRFSMTAMVFDLHTQTTFEMFTTHFAPGLFSILANNDMIYCENKYLLKSLFTDFEYRSNYEITQIKASSEFGIVVFSNIIGEVLIVDFSMNLVKTLSNLDASIYSLDITKHFGYIVIHTSSSKLIVLTLNGSTVIDYDLKQCSISKLLTFSSIKGLDIISFLSEDNEIHTLYYLMDNETCHGFVAKIKKSESVIDIQYDEIGHSFLITTASNKIIVIPQIMTVPDEIPDRMIKH